MNTSMFERLKQIRASVDLNQADFAKSLGIGQSTLAMLEVGKREILDRHVKTICSIYNVNEDWLSTGKGEMFVQSETFSLDEKAQKNNLTELEIDIMSGYMELPPDTRKELMTLFGSIYGKHAETAASLEPTPEQIAAEEAENYRQEILAELKTKTSSASDELQGKSS